MWGRATILIGLSALVMSACAGGAPKKETFSARIISDQSTNPDRTGRPSPTQVKILTLESTNLFEQADFFSLFENPEAVLGAEVKDVIVLVIAPGEEKTIKIETDALAEHVGIIAGFQDIDNATWRANAELKGFLRTRRVDVSLSGKEVTFEK